MFFQIRSRAARARVDARRPRRLRAPTRHARALAATVLVCACVTGCVRQLALPEVDGLLRDAGWRAVILDDDLSLFSPLDVATAEEYAGLVREERALVQDLLELPPADAPLLVLLREADPPSDPLAALQPSRDGVRGVADAHAVSLAVPTGPGALPPTALRDVVRHELVHVESRRAGLHGPSWWNEGLADEIAAMDTVDGRLVLQAEPLELGWIALHLDDYPDTRVFARSAAREAGRDDLFLYSFHRSAVRHLLGEHEAATFAATARAAFEARDDPDLPRRWRARAATRDVPAMIARAADSESAETRAAAAALLADLAAAGLPSALTPEADALAFRMLDDERSFTSAAAYLLFTRSRALDASLVDAAVAHDDPWVRVLGLALRRARGGDVSPAEIEAAWAAAPEDWTRELMLGDALPPGPPER